MSIPLEQSLFYPHIPKAEKRRPTALDPRRLTSIFIPLPSPKHSDIHQSHHRLPDPTSRTGRRRGAPEPLGTFRESGEEEGVGEDV
jgi:hypothetical protein